jgi:hypothetical protein
LQSVNVASPSSAKTMRVVVFSGSNCRDADSKHGVTGNWRTGEVIRRDAVSPAVQCLLKHEARRSDVGEWSVKEYCSAVIVVAVAVSADCLLKAVTRSLVLVLPSPLCAIFDAIFYPLALSHHSPPARTINLSTTRLSISMSGNRRLVTQPVSRPVGQT